MDFERIKTDFENGKIPELAVRLFVITKKLTKEQFKEITGKEFSEFVKTL